MAERPAHRAVAEDASIIELPQLSRSARSAGERALALARSLESIEAAYEAWLELRNAHAHLLARAAEERRRLDEQGALLLGAVRLAGGARAASGAGAALARAQGLEGDLEEKVAAARAALEGQIAEADAAYREALAQVRDEVRARVERRAKLVRPRLRLMLRALPGDRRILHAQRPGADEAVVLIYALARRIPSRYGYLFDDSTEDVALAPPVLYPEEGVGPADTRPRPAALRALLEPLPHVWPLKAMVPMWLPPLEGRTVAVRWIERGPVMEAEVEDAEAFRNVLSREEAERITGHLLGLKLEGRIELELVRG